MPILVVCQCGARIRAPDNLAGRTMYCPQCSHQIAVPRPSRPATPLPNLQTARPTAKPAKPPAPVVEIDDEPPPRPRPRTKAHQVVEAEDNGDEEVAPRTPSRKKSGRASAANRGIPSAVWIAAGAGAVLLVAVVAGIYMLSGGDSASAGQSVPGETDNHVAPDDLVVTVRDMIKEYETNESFAQHKYAGSMVAVSGFLLRLSHDGENKLYAELKPNRGMGGGITAKCLFRFKNEGEIQSAAPGSPLQIRGLCDGKDSTNIILKDCRYIKAVPDLPDIRERPPASSR